MVSQLKQITVNMVAGANVATVIVMFLVGFSDYLNPERYSMLSCLGLAFPVLLAVNMGFMFFWLAFKRGYVLIPLDRKSVV